ncbi:unnamed protein product [Allacma fusca]|uniref:Uncharacterized protein n=1 Tax=Allacma fusca TaxID=39272 RepID=A0A8J2PW03_9HEXA|nr:unnamed protein product [Allacma fusca]
MEKLAEEMILPHIKRRSWSGLSKDIQNSILIMGGSPPAPQAMQQTRTRGPCSWTRNDEGGNILDQCGKRSRGKCAKCRNWTCDEHGQRIFKCESCSLEDGGI